LSLAAGRPAAKLKRQKKKGKKAANPRQEARRLAAAIERNEKVLARQLAADAHNNQSSADTMHGMILVAQLYCGWG